MNRSSSTLGVLEVEPVLHALHCMVPEAQIPRVGLFRNRNGEHTPVSVICNPKVALLGAAWFCKNSR